MTFFPSQPGILTVRHSNASNVRIHPTHARVSALPFACWPLHLWLFMTNTNELSYRHVTNTDLLIWLPLWSYDFRSRLTGLHPRLSFTFWFGPLVMITTATPQHSIRLTPLRVHSVSDHTIIFEPTQCCLHSLQVHLIDLYALFVFTVRKHIRLLVIVWFAFRPNKVCHTCFHQFNYLPIVQIMISSYFIAPTRWTWLPTRLCKYYISIA